MAYRLERLGAGHSSYQTDPKGSSDPAKIHDLAERKTSADPRLQDWMESQQKVMKIWLDQLIADGDPGDLISIIHKQAAWLDLMKARTSGA